MFKLALSEPVYQLAFAVQTWLTLYNVLGYGHDETIEALNFLSRPYQVPAEAPVEGPLPPRGNLQLGQIICEAREPVGK